MPAPKKTLYTPEYWSARAEEAWVLSQMMKDDTTCRLMQGIATDYQRLAQRAENTPTGIAKPRDI